MILSALTHRQARFRGNREAIVFEDLRITFAQFEDRVNRLANALRGAGLAPGDKVATLLPNCVELLEVYWAVARVGLVAVPLSPLLHAPAIAALIDQSDAAMVFVHTETAGAFTAARDQLQSVPEEKVIHVGEPPHDGISTYRDFVADASAGFAVPAAVAPDDPLNIIYSSGTTGDPKGIVLSHRVRGLYCTLYGLAWRMTPESVVLHTGSLVFNGAFMTLMPAMYLGARYVLHHGFDAVAVQRAAAAEGVTHMIMVPTQIIALIDHPRFDPAAFDSLECLVTIGAPLLLEHKLRVQERLPGRLHELYGLAEGFQTLLDKTETAAKLASVGRPPPLFDLRIVGEDGRDLAAGEVGEIVGRGPILMSGYYKRPDLTAQAIRDGWLHSGDLGYVDQEGYLHLVDRKKDMIKSGGIAVYPRDIEEVLVRHPDIQEAAVFGITDPKWGETPVATVIARRGADLDAEAVRDWVNARVAAKFQRLSAVAAVEGFPRNAAGKVLKRELRKTYVEASKRP